MVDYLAENLADLVGDPTIYSKIRGAQRGIVWTYESEFGVRHRPTVRPTSTGIGVSRNSPH